MKQTLRKADPRIQRERITTLFAVTLLFLSILLVGDPDPVDARPVSCPISGSSTLPSKATFTSLIDAEDSEARWGRWVIWAQISDRCKSSLGKGQYLYRATWTVSLQLKSGWPVGIDYQKRDARFWTGTTTVSKTAAPANGFTYGESYRTRWSFSGASGLAHNGRDQSPLSELCFAERCTFTVEESGSYASVSGTDTIALQTYVDICFTYIPQGAEGLAETVKCHDVAGPRDYYAHPGTFGMNVRVSGTLEFEPLWTWRR